LSIPRVDLHCHSTASDGTRPPVEVVRKAVEVGLAGLSLTDHDTTRGLDEAEDEARRLGVRFLAGAEISATAPEVSVHLLAFGFDRSDHELQRFLTAFDGDRRSRARRMVTRLQDLDVPVDYGDVEDQAGGAAPTRAHVARALVAGGHVTGEREAFSRYLSRGRPAFVSKRDVAPVEVFRVVHAAGGVVVLAHPGREHDSDSIRRWASEGLDGVEVFHPANSASTRSRLNALAVELGLLRSGGSDWHGPGTRRSGLGSEPVPVRWLEMIESRCTGAASGRGTRRRSPNEESE